MGESDLINALSHTKRDKKIPLICWEDAITRSKTISLPEELQEKEVDHTPTDDALDAKRFYLTQPPPRPPRTAPLTGKVTLVHSKGSPSNSNQGPANSVSDSDILRITIKPSSEVSGQVSNILSKYAPFSEWKFDVYLTDLTRGLHLNTFLDRVLDNTEFSCINIPLVSILPKGKTVADIKGHKLKVSVTGVWPLRFYLVNCVIPLGEEKVPEKRVVLPDEDDKDWTYMDPESYVNSPSIAPTTTLLATTRAAQLDGLIHRQSSKKSKSKPPSSATPLSIRSVNCSRDSTPGSRPPSRPIRSSHRAIPSAQKSFQKLLQIKQQSRHEMMSRIEKDQIGIRVLAGTVIFD